MVAGARPFISQDIANAVRARDSGMKMGYFFQPATPALAMTEHAVVIARSQCDFPTRLSCG